MKIEDKIQNIIEFLTKVGFVQLYYGQNEEFTQRVGIGKANYNDFIILQKTISKSELLCCRIEKQTLNLGGILGEKQYDNIILNLHDLNIFQIKDDMLGHYFFETDMSIQNEYDAIIDELKEKFKHELRKYKVNNLLS